MILDKIEILELELNLKKSLNILFTKEKNQVVLLLEFILKIILGLVNQFLGNM